MLAFSNVKNPKITKVLILELLMQFALKPSIVLLPIVWEITKTSPVNDFNPLK